MGAVIAYGKIEIDDGDSGPVELHKIKTGKPIKHDIEHERLLVETEFGLMVFTEEAFACWLNL